MQSDEPYFWFITYDMIYQFITLMISGIMIFCPLFCQNFKVDEQVLMTYIDITFSMGFTFFAFASWFLNIIYKVYKLQVAVNQQSTSFDDPTCLTMRGNIKFCVAYIAILTFLFDAVISAP